MHEPGEGTETVPSPGSFVDRIGHLGGAHGPARGQAAILVANSQATPGGSPGRLGGVLSDPRAEPDRTEEPVRGRVAEWAESTSPAGVESTGEGAPTGASEGAVGAGLPPLENKKQSPTHGPIDRPFPGGPRKEY